MASVWSVKTPIPLVSIEHVGTVEIPHVEIDPTIEIVVNPGSHSSSTLPVQGSGFTLKFPESAFSQGFLTTQRA